LFAVIWLDLLHLTLGDLKKGTTAPFTAALHQAQLPLKAMHEYSHPFYWAPFVMIGDWR
jgi:CHAT domain-containing protein